jgi:hypothetical protein
MNPDLDPVCSRRSDPDPVQIGPDPQHWTEPDNTGGKEASGKYVTDIEDPGRKW